MTYDDRLKAALACLRGQAVVHNCSLVLHEAGLEIGTVAGDKVFFCNNDVTSGGIKVSGDKIFIAGSPAPALEMGHGK